MYPDLSTITRNARNGVIIDTNLLIIYLIGLYNERYIELCLPGNLVYFPGDFGIIKSFLQTLRVDKCIVTPHILAEVSNLTFDKFNNRGMSEYVKRALSYIGVTKEEHTHKDDLLSKYHLPFLGFTDSSIIEAAKREKYVVLTEDVTCATILNKENCYVVNINHLRTLKL